MSGATGWGLYLIKIAMAGVVACVLALAVSLSMSFATAACESLRDGPKGKVTEVVDGDTLMLDNGIVVRLIGMQAPKLALGRPGFEDWPLGDTARQHLTALTLNRQVRLRYGGEETDRYGRALAHVFVEGEASPVWAQGAIVGAGMARVYSFPDNRACLAELFAAERDARLKRLGIWADPYYSIGQADHPEALSKRAGHYELVEGRVLTAEKSGGRVYLNFGRHWKQDFTIVIESHSLKGFAASGWDPLVLEDALVRVRGWVDDRDGPRIEVTHPEQIEVLATR